MGKSLIPGIVIFAFFLSAALLPSLAQEGTPPGEEPAPQGEPTPPVEPDPPEEPDPQDRLAFEIPGQQVSRTEVLQKLQEEMGPTYRELLITRYLVAAAAEEAGVDVSQAAKRAEEQIQKWASHPRYGGNIEVFEKEISTQGISLRLLREIQRTRFLTELMIGDNREVPDNELRAIFEAKYGKDGIKRRVRHILAAVNMRSSELFSREDYLNELKEIEAKALAAAEGVLKRARGGEEFTTLVLEVSDDRATATKKLQGDLSVRWQRHGKEFEEVVRKTPVGEIGGPAKSARGYHLVQVTGQAPSEFRAQHILLSTTSLASLPKEEQEAQMEVLQKRAEQIVQEAQGGKDFGELAKQHSDDRGTSGNGGDMGRQRLPGRYGPEFEKAIGEMRGGEIRGPIQSRMGLHVVKLQSKAVLPTVRHCLFSTEYPIEREKRVRPFLERKSMEKIDSLLQSLEGGEEFAALAASHSDDAATKGKGGEIATYRPEQYGEEFHAAVAEMKPGDPARVVKSRFGVHLVELVEVQVTGFETVQEEVRSLWLHQHPVRPADILTFHKKLRTEAHIE